VVTKTTALEDDDLSLSRYKSLVTLSFAVTCLLNILIMATGYLTFGTASQGVILNNYASTDKWATLCRALMAFSVIGSYPLVFRGMRISFQELTGMGGKSATRVLLAGITAGALSLKNAGFVVSFNGATMGSAIIYIFPALMYLQLAKQGVTTLRRGEKTFNKTLIALGCFLGVAGGGVSILDSFFPGVL
jgi:amino acid permease